PSGAMSGHDDVRRQPTEAVERGVDDRLEQRAVEVEAADDRTDLVHAGQSLGVAADVDDARVPAAGQHDQSATGNVRDQRLVVEDERVGLPAVAAPSLVDREATFEVGGAVNLTGDQHRAVEQERRLPLLDDVEPGVLQRAAAGGRKQNRLATGNGQTALRPELGMDDHRHVAAAEPVHQTRQSGRVVEVAVTADNYLDVVDVPAEAPQVLDAAVRREAGVEQHPSDRLALADLGEDGEAVLRQGRVDDLSLDQRRRVQCWRTSGAARPEPSGRTLIGEQDVDGVVAYGQHRYLVDRFESQDLTGPIRVGRDRVDYGRICAPTNITHQLLLHDGSGPPLPVILEHHVARRLRIAENSGGRKL